MARYKYLLGDSRGEAERLRFQAKLWDPVSLALFDERRALGCTPVMDRSRSDTAH